MGKTIKVAAPGSVANVGVGFDMLGFAVDGLGDYLTIQEHSLEGLLIESIKGHKNTIPKDPHKNTAGVAILEMCSFLGVKPNYQITIEKRSPVGSGLGSSASSAVAAVFALNEILDSPFKEKHQLLPFAIQGEAMASGAIHADNVAPSLLGGLIAIRSLYPLDWITIPMLVEFQIVLICPHLEILTKSARNLIPKMIPLDDVTRQMGNLSALIIGMVEGNLPLLKRSFTDYLAVPYRSHLIPGYEEVCEAALSLGAIGCSIAGSGPSIFALIPGFQDSKRIAEGMKSAFHKQGLESDIFLTSINKSGAILV